MRLAYAAAAALAAAALIPAAPANAQDAPAVTLAQARASMAGAWAGELQYLDYQSGEWQGIPVSISITLEADGTTLSRRAAFDDGPKVGMVHITSLAMLGRDGVTEHSTAFRAGRTPELGSDTLTLTAAADALHWTIEATRTGQDDNRPARIRETTIRDGTKLTTLKQVAFLDAPGEQWFSRNRTVLEQARP